MANVINNHCECGCGEETTIFRGKPRRFVYGHNCRGKNNSFYGKSHSDETKEKMSERKRGHKLSEEHKKALSESKKGHIVTEITKKKLSEAVKGKFGINHPAWKGGEYSGNNPLIFCACGCGQQRKMYDKQGVSREYISGHQGIHHSEVVLAKMSKPRSEVGKRNMSKAQTGKHEGENNRMYGVRNFGNNNPHWKGGHKVAMARARTIRRQFGFIPLNECRDDGWEGHHIDKDHVLFIPAKLHKSIYHSIVKNINMDIINDKVYEWFINEYIKEMI